MHRIPAFRALLAHPSPPRADFVALLADGNLAYFVGTDARGRRFELIRIGHQRAYLHSSSGQPFHVLAASQIARHAISTGYFGATSVRNLSRGMSPLGVKRLACRPPLCGLVG